MGVMWGGQAHWSPYIHASITRTHPQCQGSAFRTCDVPADQGLVQQPNSATTRVSRPSARLANGWQTEQHSRGKDLERTNAGGSMRPQAGKALAIATDMGYDWSELTAPPSVRRQHWVAQHVC